MSVVYNKASPYKTLAMVTWLLIVTGWLIIIVIASLPDSVLKSDKTPEEPSSKHYEESGVRISGYYIPNERLEETSTLVATCIMNIPKETKYFNLGVKFCMDEAKELYGLPLNDNKVTEVGEKY